MPLVTSQGYQLTPDVLGGLGRGVNFAADLQNLVLKQQQLQKQQQVQDLLSGAATSTAPAQSQQQQMLSEQTAELAGVSPQAEAEQPVSLMSQDELIQKAKSIDPAFAVEQLKLLGIDDDSKRAEASRFAARVESLPVDQQNEAILERASILRSQGRNPKDTLELLDMSPAQRAQALQGIQLLDLSTKERFSVKEKEREAIEKQSNLKKVQSSNILPGGAVQVVYNDGSVEVKQPNEVEETIIKNAEERGTKLQQNRAHGRRIGSDAAKISTEVAKQVDNLRSNNASLRQVIKEVEGGAETGPLAAKLPSFRAESVRLDQLRNKLGLDVVGSVTFGALSEGELKLALDTALPTKLDGPQLVKWAQEKITAQEKLAKYLEDQSIYLSNPDHTPAGWKQFRRSQSLKDSQSGTTVQPQQIGRFTVEVMQ